jgi:hypothetical protein
MGHEATPVTFHSQAHLHRHFHRQFHPQAQAQVQAQGFQFHDGARGEPGNTAGPQAFINTPINSPVRKYFL